MSEHHHGHAESCGRNHLQEEHIHSAQGSGSCCGHEDSFSHSPSGLTNGCHPGHDHDHGSSCHSGHDHDHGSSCHSGHDHDHGDGCHPGHDHNHGSSCHCGHDHGHGDGCHCGHDHGHGDGCRCGHDHGHGADEEEMKEMKLRLIISGSLFVLLLISEHILKLSFMQNRAVSTVCYLIPYLIVGRDVIREAFEGLVHGEVIGEQFLMVIASAGAFLTGENAEAAAVLILYSLGELLQEHAVRRSRASVRELMDLTPEYANLVTGADGACQRVNPEELTVGSRIVILPGEKIPVDGTVLSGSGMIDTSSMTGESVPRSVREGDAVISGCINGSGSLTVRVDKEYRNSTAAKVMELTEEAGERKSRTENFTAAFARVYTPAVVIAALLLTAIPPLFFREPFLLWFRRACTFLVISCPCALVISVPLCFFCGIGAAGRAGILIKGSNFMEALSRAAVFASDKTGTLTKGEFQVTDVQPAGNRKALLRLAAAAEYHSGHPIAKSIMEAAETAGIGKETIPVPAASRYISGRGMEVQTEGGTVLAGNERMMKEAGIRCTVSTEPGTHVYLAKNGVFLGSLLISDTVKPEAETALRQLKEEGIRRTVLLTGDSAETGEYMKKALGLDEVRSELLPQDKVACLEEYIAQCNKKERLIYAGDGINDAPVLARADIGIAMGSLGSDAAIEAADVVIMDDSLLKIPLSIRIAKKTLRICRQNIVFILTVKAAFLLLGAFGMTGMWMAVFADVGVAFLCILNSMRTLARKENKNQ